MLLLIQSLIKTLRVMNVKNKGFILFMNSLFAIPGLSCLSSGGFLPSIVSEFEQAYIYLTMRQKNVSSVWIGLNDIKVRFGLVGDSSTFARTPHT